MALLRKGKQDYPRKYVKRRRAAQKVTAPKAAPRLHEKVRQLEKEMREMWVLVKCIRKGISTLQQKPQYKKRSSRIKASAKKRKRS